MVFNYNKLRGKIKEKCITQSNYAKLLGVSETAISSRLNNTTDFTQEEILTSCRVLGIPVVEMNQYFFTPEVQKHERSEVASEQNNA